MEEDMLCKTVWHHKGKYTVLGNSRSVWVNKRNSRKNPINKRFLYQYGGGQMESSCHSITCLQRIVEIEESRGKLDWPPVLSDRQVLRSRETGKLCTESCSDVSTLVTARMAALIGQGDSKPNYWLHCHHVNTSTSQGWTDELQSGQCLWRRTSPNFG